MYNPLSVVAKTEVRYASQSARPTAPSTDDDISDSAENTCAAFDYSTNCAKFTKIRINITLPAGEGDLMISGESQGSHYCIVHTKIAKKSICVYYVGV